jgi:hypothetical protein
VTPTATANTSQDNYAQLGHGGYTSSGYGGNATNAFTGDISVLSRAGDIRFLAGNATDAYVQLGHGGRAANEGAIGAIRVAAQGGSFVLAGGPRAQAYGLLGHGGDTTLGNRTGDIHVRAAGEVQLLAGAATRAASMIGHGGYDGDGDHFGNILVSAGSGALATHLGTGLFDDLGDFDLDGFADLIQFAPVTAGQSSVRVTAAGGTDAFAMIGHGGRSSGNVLGTTAASTMEGHVGVAAHGDIVLAGSSGARAFAQIGHGGWEDPAQNMTLGGDISVVSQTGLLRVLAGSAARPTPWSAMARCATPRRTCRSAAARAAFTSRPEIGKWCRRERPPSPASVTAARRRTTVSLRGTPSRSSAMAARAPALT